MTPDEMAARASAHWEKTLSEDCEPCKLDGTAFWMRFCRYRGMDRCKHAPAIAERIAVEGRQLRLARGSVPRTFWAPILGDGLALRDTQALGHVRQLLADPRGGLLILGGPCESGKSFAAGWGVAERGGCFVSASDLGRPLDRRAGEIDPMTTWKRAPLLAVDDVGLDHAPGGFFMAQASELVRHRAGEGLPIVVTTNLREADVVARLGGERVSTRFGAFGYRVCLDRIARRAA